MLHTNRKYSSLRDHLAGCRPAISFGLSPNVRAVIVVSYLDEAAEALAYVAGQCPKAVTRGVCPVPRNAVEKRHIETLAAERPATGVPFLTPDALGDYPDAAILVYCAKENTVNDLKALAPLMHALRWVGHVFVYPELSDGMWCTWPDPNFYAAHKERLEACYAMLTDAESTRSFASVVKSIVTGAMGYIRASEFGHYRYPRTWPRQGETVIDGGISSSVNIVCQLAEAVGPTGHVFGFEPSPECFSAARAQLAQRREGGWISLSPLGLFSCKTDLHILNNGPGSILRDEAHENTAPCTLTDLDSFVAEHNIARVDVIKLDVEGAEVPTLYGAAHTLRTHRPRLLLSAYHNSRQDIMAIPEALREIEPAYKLHFATSYMFIGEFMYYAWC